MADSTILIVEDERIVAKDLELRLKMLGYVIVGSVASGEEAVQLTAQLLPDLVIMDIRLNGELDGIEAADRIRKKHFIPVIYLTAHSDEETLQRAQLTEPYGYLLKPFQERELRTAIEMGLYKHRMERKIRDGERRYATTLSSIGDGVIATDRFGVVTFINPVAENLTGWKASAAIGTPLSDVFRIHNENTRKFVEKPVDRVLREGVAIGLANHTILTDRNGVERPIDDCAAPILDDLGIQDGAVFIFRDISERIRAEQNLRLAHEVASRAKNEFLANMSHEIRTPLTAILGFVDILSDEETLDKTPEVRKQIAHTIKNAGAHLLAIISDILDLSKIEADKLTVEQVDTRLVNILCEVEKLMLQTATGKGLTLSMEISSPLPDRIKCDPTRLRQILMNLVGNAIKFTEEGTVKITAGQEDQDGQSRLVIDIADTGAGMTPEQVQGLFQAFSQSDSTATRRHGGAGLGLNISRRLARIMDGDVTLLYSELGKGSCFRIVLPIKQVEGSTTITSVNQIELKGEPDPIVVTSKLTGRILLAEDGLDNQRLIQFVMRRAGATIETADNGRIALSMLDQAEAAGTPFDLLVTDMQMPEMDGYSLARTLRDRGSKLPIIALTANAMADDRKKCLDAGCDDYVAKPIDKSILIATCAARIGQTRDEE